MEYFKITIPQKNILNVRKIYENTGISNICGALIFEDKLDTALLEEAVNEELRLQSGMRLSFCVRGGETCQYIREYESERFEHIVFRSYEELEHFGEEFARVPFELYNSRMYRIKLFDIDGRSGIILCASHLITDAWTYSILANEVHEIYSCLSQNKSHCLTERSYTDYIISEEKYFSSPSYAADKAYWTERYASSSEPFSAGTERNGRYIPSAGRITEKIPADISSGINSFCKENKISYSVLFEAAAAIYFSKTDNERKAAAIGVPVLNRSNSREKKTAGNFILTLPVTVTLSDKDTVMSVCEKISARNKEVFRHRKYPYDEIVKEAHKNQELPGSLYSVMVSCQNAKTDIKASTIWFSNGFSEVPLSLHFDDRDGTGSYTVTADHMTEIFPRPEAVSLIVKRIIHVITQMISDKNAALDKISVLPYEEYKKIIFDFNDTAAAYPENKCVHELFSEQAKRTPDKTAVVFKGRSHSFRELDEMSNSIAHFLRGKGIKRNDTVPIAARRSPHILAAMLGILKAGGAYMPVSPDYPAERIKFMINDAGAKLMLTYGFSSGLTEEVPLDGFDYLYDTSETENINSPDDLCYIIYTSGSSGLPKGTAVTHKNTVNYCSENKFNVCGKIFDRNETGIVSVTNYIFDIFVTESILPLLNGIKIFLADEEQTVSQRKLSRLITENNISVIQTTPTKMRSYILNGNDLKYLSVLKKIILGGESFPADLYHELKKHTDAEIYNIYGPAETTVWSSFELADPNDITIGRPSANTMIYILDKNAEPLPAETAGELCISGDGVGKGYISDPKMTREKFIPNPFIKGQTIYRTGDMARIRTDGKIEFLGRMDSQIKIRGMRVEPGETESVMNSFDKVELAAVSFADDERGTYLTGYYTSGNMTEPSEVRAYLSERLPAHMIPRYIMRVDKIPLTPSGKIDRKNLPEPDMNEAADNYSAPETKNEKILCDIISRILGVPCAGTNADFFEIGGDSFGAMELSAEAEERGLDVSLENIFRYRTVKKICAHIADKDEAIMRRVAVRAYPMTRSESDIAAFKIFSYLTEKIYKFEISGLEKLDFGKKYIFCPNHESDLDCMWVLAALKKRININDTCALIASEHLSKTVPKKIFKIIGGIPVDRKGDFSPALKRAEEVISNEKKYLIIHPEGTRTRTGKLGIFKQGAAAISKNTGIDIVPVCITGARRIFPPSEKFPGIFDAEKRRRYCLRIKFGKPVSPDGLSREQLTEKVRRQIIKLRAEAKDDNRR